MPHLKEMNVALITSKGCMPKNTCSILFSLYCYVFIIADQEVPVEYKMP